MKAIIHGVRYDTRKATLIGEAGHSDPGDLTHWSAGLYRTPKSNRFFLAGEGGMMTRWRTGKGIVPLDDEDALAWAEQYLTAAEVMAAFEEMVA